MNILDPATGLSLGDPEVPPLDSENAPDGASVVAAAEAMILSASGWRTIFAAGGDEESCTTEVTPAGLVLAAAAADVFGRYMLGLMGAEPGERRQGDRPISLCVGLDTRPTGPVLAHVMIRRFLSLGIEPEYLFVSAAPEIMAYVKRARGIDGFAYISASHNPIGHNGLKFGGRNGGVLGGSEIKPLIGEYRDLLGHHEAVRELCKAVGSVPAAEVERIFGRSAEIKSAALFEYAEHLREVAAGTDAGGTGIAGEEIQTFFAGLGSALETSPLGIVADLNGSARTVSVDRSILEETGFEVEIMNGTAGKIAHRIVPEGESLEPCRRKLEELAAAGRDFVLGYVPDCDGDRGNIVYYDERGGRAKSLEAQEVLALAVLSELGYLAVTGRLDLAPAAVAVNGPTSMRIDRIAAAYGVKTVRSEVGEANVVGLARRLRKEGYTVRVLGEGSNGGTIIHPSAVRDPLTTLFSLFKILRSDAGIFADWLGRTGRPPGGFGEKVTDLADVIRTLPRFVTTSAYEPEAIMRITTTDHAALKSRYEEIFLAEWEERRLLLGEEYGITGFEEVNYEGDEERRGFGPAFRTGGQKGGLKILLTGEDSAANSAAPVPRAFLWMRGSGTEPVFRVLVDVDAEGCGSMEKATELHDYLLEWNREMVREAGGGA
ncbi:MAG: phosphatidylglycerol lysyltransferase [Spirochaetia bacterium]